MAVSMDPGGEQLCILLTGRHKQGLIFPSYNYLVTLLLYTLVFKQREEYIDLLPIFSLSLWNFSRITRLRRLRIDKFRWE